MEISSKSAVDLTFFFIHSFITFSIWGLFTFFMRDIFTFYILSSLTHNSLVDVFMDKH